MMRDMFGISSALALSEQFNSFAVTQSVALCYCLSTFGANRVISEIILLITPVKYV
jgi:hypothetical protein